MEEYLALWGVDLLLACPSCYCHRYSCCCFEEFGCLLKYVILLILLATIFVAGIGITKITLESDLSKLNPVGLPITDLNSEIDIIFQELEGNRRGDGGLQIPRYRPNE